MTAEPTAVHIAKEIAHERSLISGRFHPSGELLFVGSEDFQVWRFRLADDSKVAYPTEAWVRGIVFPTDEVVVTGGYDGRLIWWPTDGEAPAAIRVVDAHQGWIRAVALSPDRSLIATCGNDLAVRLWSSADGSLVRELTGHERHVYHVAFHPDGESIVAGDLTAKFRQWSVASGELQREFVMPTLHKYDAGFMADYGGPYCLTFDPTGEKLAGGGITNVSNAFAGVGNPAIAVIDWASAAESVAHLSKAGTQGKAWGVVWHPENFVVAATGGQGGGWLMFWKAGEKDEFHAFNLNNTARDLDLHPDGLLLATVHHDGRIRLSKMAPAA